MENKNEILKLSKEMFFSENESIYIHRSRGDYNGILHRHDFIELVCVISGSAVHTVDDISYPIEKGNVVMVDCGVPHAFSFDGSADDPFETYDLLFTPDFFNVLFVGNNDFYSLASSYLFGPLFSESGTSDVPQNLIDTNTKTLRKLFDLIYTEYTERKLGFQSIIHAHLTELIVKIFREINESRPELTENQEDLVKHAVGYMRENYMSPINLDNIVSNMFISKNYFRQLFKKTTGISVSNYIQQIRIERAKDLLRNTDEASADIAYKCGFNDVKFFYKTFKKATGVTPSEYRQSVASQER